VTVRRHWKDRATFGQLRATVDLANDLELLGAGCNAEVNSAALFAADL
jgi:hypothetical protein